MREKIRDSNGVSYLIAQLSVSFDTVVIYSLRALSNLCVDPIVRDTILKNQVLFNSKVLLITTTGSKIIGWIAI